MLSFVITVYNEQACLRDLNIRILNSIKKINEKFEIIYIDDGSSDESLKIIKELSIKNNDIKYISFIRNFGQHAAVMAGFAKARGKYIFTLDADLQNPPEEISKLYNEITKGDYDIVTGVRSTRKDGFFRKLPSLLMNKVISSLTGVKLKDYGCMMRVYRKNIIENLIKYGEKSVYIPAYTSWLTKKILEVSIKHDPRRNSKSKYNFLSLFNQVFDLITAYTIIPIRMIVFTGIFIFFSGLFLFIYLMYHRLVLNSADPLTSFIAILLFLTGLILFSIGIISEYLLRLYKELRKTPFYIIKEEK